MARQHGITANTYKKFVIDSGAVYLDYGEAGETLLGATRGGNVFNVETEYRDMEVDGAKGPVKGGRRITNVSVSLTANFVELTATIMNKILTGSSVADYPDTPSKTHDQITRSLSIALSDYATNVALVGEVTGNSTYPAIFIVKNSIVDGNFELTMADDDETVLAAEFKGHFDPSDVDTEPWEIRYPEIA